MRGKEGKKKRPMRCPQKSLCPVPKKVTGGERGGGKEFQRTKGKNRKEGVAKRAVIPEKEDLAAEGRVLLIVLMRMCAV